MPEDTEARIARLERSQERAWAAIEVLAQSHDKLATDLREFIAAQRAGNEHLDNCVGALVSAIGEFIRRQPHQQ